MPNLDALQLLPRILDALNGFKVLFFDKGLNPIVLIKVASRVNSRLRAVP